MLPFKQCYSFFNISSYEWELLIENKMPSFFFLNPHLPLVSFLIHPLCTFLPQSLCTGYSLCLKDSSSKNKNGSLSHLLWICSQVCFLMSPSLTTVFKIANILLSVLLAPPYPALSIYFLNQVIILLLLLIWDINLLLDIWFVNIFSHSICCIFVYGFLCCAKVLKFD